MQFAVPSHNVDIIWHVAEFPRLKEVSRKKGEKDGDRQGEPEVC